MMYKKIILLIFALLLGCKTNNDQIGNSKVKKYLNLSKNNSLSPEIQSNNCLKAFQILKESKKLDSNSDIDLDYILNRFASLNNLKDFKRASMFMFLSAKRKNDTLRIAKAYHRLSYYFMKENLYDSAYYFGLKAKEIYFKKKDYKNLAKCSYIESTILLDINDFRGSETSAIEALKYARRTKMKDIEYCSLIIMGIISNCLEDYEKAIKNDFEAFKLIRDNNLIENNRKENCYNNIGGVYQNMNYHSKAITFFKCALLNKKLQKENPELFSTLIDNLAYSNLCLGKCKNVEYLLKRALKIRQKLSLTKTPISFMHLSEYYARQGDTINAIQFSKMSVKDAQILHDPQNMLQILKCALKINKFDKNKYSKEYIKISDSLQLAERKNLNKFARIAFETDEITTEKNEAIKQKWIILSIAAAIFLLGVLMFIIKMQRAKQKELILIHEQQKSDESIYQLIHDQQLKIDEGRHAEKLRISRELHDGVMNKLTSTRLNLFILNKKKDDETINKCLKYIDDIQDIEKEIRKVAHDLSDDLFSGNKSFNLLLGILFESYEAISDTEILPEIDSAINWETVDNILKMNLYRILQEIINNCNKYAQAKHIFITITKQIDCIFTHTHDDGKGFDQEKFTKGIGIKNISQRISSLNGKLNIYSQPNEGTTISFFLPTIK